MTDANETTPKPQPRPRPGLRPWAGYLISPVFLLLALWFILAVNFRSVPRGEAGVIDPLTLSTAPRRSILGDPPVVNIDGFERTCMDCHRMFPPREDPPAKLMQHAHVVLNHGINDRCRNCHFPLNRDKLILRGGKIIDYTDAVELCAKCHGVTYRDWRRGAHGRTNGYWDANSGEIRRLQCTECHDPHNPRVPAMDPLAPLPGPHTLRMTKHRQEDHGGKRDPLRRPIERHSENASESDSR